MASGFLSKVVERGLGSPLLLVTVEKQASPNYGTRCIKKVGVKVEELPLGNKLSMVNHFPLKINFFFWFLIPIREASTGYEYYFRETNRKKYPLSLGEFG